MIEHQAPWIESDEGKPAVRYYQKEIIASIMEYHRSNRLGQWNQGATE